MAFFKRSSAKRSKMAAVVIAAALLAGILRFTLLTPSLANAEPAAAQATPTANSKQKRVPQTKPLLDRPARPERLPPALPPAPETPAAPPPMPLPPEVIEADVSARSVAVTANFKGSEVVVFGAVDNSRQLSPEAGTYDVIVAVEGASAPAVVRRKSNVAGLWMNTASATFDRAPSYYAVASTRPLDEIAEADVLAKFGIGIGNVQLTANPATVSSTHALELRDFQSALGRLKIKEGLYTHDDYGVTFSGRSLFRSTLALPANVPVGQLVARVYLFREGVLLNRFTTRVGLERTGIERFIFESARTTSWLYGIFTVFLAVMCGLAASLLFGRVGN